MENVNWLKLKLNQKMMNLQSAKANINANSSTDANITKNLVQNTHNKIINQYQQQYVNPQQLRMNNLASIDRAVYIKNLLNLPKDMTEFLVLVQNNGKIPVQKPQTSNNPNNVLNQHNHNQNNSVNNQKPQNSHVLQNQHQHQNQTQKLNHQQNNLQPQENILNKNNNHIKENIQNKPESFINNTQQNIKQSPLLNNHNNANLHNAVRNNVKNGIVINQQIAQNLEMSEQIQAENQKTQGMTAEELANFKQNLASQLNANVNLTQVSAFLQKNSKLAMNRMVSMMSMATAQGMTDVKPLQETMNIINASVSANSQSDSTQTLKNLMLLYLPWLPLQEGVGFDLEIEQEDDTPESDTFIKILITTVNYGNVYAVVSLISGNSVDISITCSEKFPKKELFKRLQKDSNQHSMQTVIDIKEQKPQEQIETLNPKAKVNLSNVNQVNPYLLLMSHAVIRHTIELDATVSIGVQPIED